MTIIRITKEFNFEMAHALWNYDGACRNIHGHSYKLFVCLKGEVVNDADHPKNGMVADFGDLKQWINELLISKYDHSLVVSREADMSCLAATQQMFANLHIVDFQPTCENLLIHFAELIQNNIPGNLSLYSLKLYETQTSFAEWYAEDN